MSWVDKSFILLIGWFSLPSNKAIVDICKIFFNLLVNLSNALGG